jgi:hypothetical protein
MSLGRLISLNLAPAVYYYSNFLSMLSYIRYLLNTSNSSINANMGVDATSCPPGALQVSIPRHIPYQPLRGHISFPSLQGYMPCRSLQGYMPCRSLQGYMPCRSLQRAFPLSAKTPHRFRVPSAVCWCEELVMLFLAFPFASRDRRLALLMRLLVERRCRHRVRSRCRHLC